MADDAAIMTALARGDAEALAAVARRLAVPVRAVATRIVGSGSADDVVQETLERVWRHAASYDDGRGTIEAWALRIARNVAIGHLRRERTRSGRTGELGAVLDLDRVADAGPEPAEIMERAAIAGAVRSAVRRLRPERRSALECVLAGHTLIAAADLLGLPEGTLKSRVRAAYADLRPDPSLIALVG
jgi:RNA polymerase sigma-70 factor (ECF subfamily)